MLSPGELTLEMLKESQDRSEQRLNNIEKSMTELLVSSKDAGTENKALDIRLDSVERLLLKINTQMESERDFRRQLSDATNMRFPLTIMAIMTIVSAIITVIGPYVLSHLK